MTWRQGNNPDRNPARKCVVLGKSCDSQMEGKRWLELSMMERAGEIRDLVHHPRYQLRVPGFGEMHLVCTYEADSQYVSVSTGLLIVEDVKGRRCGPAWSLFRVKAKLLRALYGFDVSLWPVVAKNPRRKR